MKELLVQTYLKSGKSLDDLYRDHGVKSFSCNDKIGLTYDMIEASDSDKLSQQCRGLILRDKTYDVVAAPMFRFFNLEQKGLIPELDWDSVKFLEKHDGTLIIVYFDHKLNKWCCATRSRPEADGNIDGGDLTFAKLLDHTIKFKFSERFDFNGVSPLNELLKRIYNPTSILNKTFCFELTSPYNRIVCKYEQPDITLLAVRDNESLLEEDPRDYSRPEYGLFSAKEYKFKNINHMIQVVRDWDPKDHEGVVICDKYFNRIKCKNPKYVAYNHMRDSLGSSVRECAKVVLFGNDDDLYGMLPELIVERIEKIKEVVSKVFKITNKEYEEIKHIDDMKEFALKATKCLWPAALFSLKRNKVKDLKTFIIGKDGEKLSNSSVDNFLAICKKVDGSVLDV